MAEQLLMFETDTGGPKGLRYSHDFIFPEFERELVARIQALPLEPFQFGQFEGKRRGASFGWRYNYSTRQLEQAERIPAWLSDIVAAIESFGGAGTEIRQVLCTEYEAGVGIGWHRDKPHFDRIFGLSLGSPCKFRLRRSVSSSWQRFTLNTEARSLYMMSGDSRRVWEHSIPAVEALRYSITFRTTVDATTF